MKEVSAIFVHGVGEQTHDFASAARKQLSGALAVKGVKLRAASVHWAPLADQLEHNFLRNAQLRGSTGNLTQRLVVGTLADAIAYQASERLREQIAYLIDYEYTRLRVPEVHVFAHSLGGLISLDWLRTRNNVRPAHLWTLGCNVGLFNLGRQFDCPLSVAGAGRWSNLFYPSDLLGFPLQAQPGFGHVQDVAIRSAGFWRMSTIVPGLRHLDYWSDSRLWGDTLPGLMLAK
jgi:pimeloyl-ACP methyl ester carboxylesterase